jgi:predicted alpha-1,2-mannosidase
VRPKIRVAAQAVVVTLVAATAPVIGAPAPATAAAASFSSSFEPTNPLPTWQNTVDGNRASGVDGNAASGIPGSVADRVVAIAANAEPNSNEGKENLNDGDPNSKWLADTTTGWASYTLSEPIRITRYALTSANDAQTRDPRDWALQGSADGQNWTNVDTRAGETFGQRFQLREFAVATPGTYRHYRLNITANSGAPLTQLADWQLSDGTTAPAPPTMRSRLSSGPASSPTAKSKAGYHGLAAFEVSGRQTVAGRAYSYNKVFDVDVDVTANTELSYMVFPEFTTGDMTYPATSVAIDLAFTDGTFLSQLNAVDSSGAVLSPTGQAAAKTLWPSQWNKVRSRIGGVAAGKTIDRILVGYDRTGPVTTFRSYFDDVSIGEVPPEQPEASLAQYVETRRGTQSSGSYSRGNNFPATAVPHGFNFWTPVTNAGTTSWLYEYHRANNAQNLPTLQGFAASHQPSPWMGDRQTFQVMPVATGGTPNASRAARALPFQHENETAMAHYYGVQFENGLKTEIAPTDHAALFRFTFPGNQSSLIFDNVDANSGLTIDAANRAVSAYSDVRSGLSTGASRMFLYAVVDKPITASGMLPDGNRPSTGYLQVDTSASKTVTMRVATSLISVAQAKKNLELEIAAGDTLESVRDRAEQAWNAKLRTVEVEGASKDQLTTLYSNLYRLFLYPNSAHENTGTAAAPVWRHAVQSATSSPPPGSSTQTGATIADGKVYVNNGFWDTYRTTWPAYALLTPSMTGEMIDGFTQQYKDGGWISRWSSPGYANLMVGTSSDVAFADAYLKGVRNFDVAAAYDAAIRNATVNQPNANVGRKGFASSIFKGYTPSDSTGEAMSWAMDGYINDFGIANMADARAKEGGPNAARYAEQAKYFRERATQYVNMFDPNAKFFQGRTSAGAWRVPSGQYDPRVWGYDYTETNGWNMAFHVPQDGQGLANLYGGKAALASKLDTFFSTPETAGFPGSYGGVIHEMIEARDVRMGQYGHSNQPSHHIPYMYNYVGQPSKTQAKVREITSRLYLGSEIGQGYAGDEDNGEMSAWYIFSALGFYPLQMGSTAYTIGSPLFTKATINLENGKKIVVNAPGNSARNVYVQSLRVNGAAYTSTSLPHSALANGATLDFTMGSSPSTWGAGANDAPPSLTTGSAVARPARDATRPGGGTPAALFDDTSATRATVSGPLQYRITGTAPLVSTYTLTSSDTTGGDPTGWTLKGSYNGTTWTTIDQRSAQNWQWRLQTRPFTIASPARYSYYRFEFTGSTNLAEVELLAKPDALFSDASPDPQCDTTVTESSSSIAAHERSVCVLPGAVVTGSISLSGGASLYAAGATVKGSVTASSAGNVVLNGVTVAGPVTATGARTGVNIEGSTVQGPLTLTGNQGTALVSGNTITGGITCSSNNPNPTDNGLPNDVTGLRLGQCTKL